MEEDYIGRHALLKEPYKGYRMVEILECSGDKYEVEICGSGKRIEVYLSDLIFE